MYSVGLDLPNGSSNTQLVYQVRAFTCEVSRSTSSKTGRTFRMTRQLFTMLNLIPGINCLCQSFE